jgi:cysteine-rich repeat protein
MAAAAIFLALMPATTAGAANGLSLIGSLQDSAVISHALKGVHSVTTSPDGKHLYVTSSKPGALAVFVVTDSGGASFVETHTDSNTGIGGVGGATEAAVSPDGTTVYVAGFGDNTIGVYARNPATGALTFVEQQRDAVNGVDGLDGASAVTVSPDGTNVYATGERADALVVFSRDSATGALQFRQVLRAGVNGVAGLNGVRGVAVSPDGATVYVAASNANSVSAFTRDATTGMLTFLETYRDNTGGILGVGKVRQVVVSPDGANVYAAGQSDNAIAVFSRDGGTGKLTFLQALQDAVDGVDGLAAISDLVITADGRYVYTSGDIQGTAAAFVRDLGTGTLTFVATQRDGVGKVLGLKHAKSITVTPDGLHVYVTASRSLAFFGTRCGDGVTQTGEQCDDGNNANNDGCSSGCQLECTSAEQCNDGDPCTTDFCLQGECANPRCGPRGARCDLKDVLPTLRDAGECTPLPPGLRGKIRTSVVTLRGLVRQEQRTGHPKVSTLLRSTRQLVSAAEAKAARLTQRGKISSDCQDTVNETLDSLHDRMRDGLESKGLCASLPPPPQ